jgi:uncharacterized metal-binding protein YceD (DUF177 family)
VNDGDIELELEVDKRPGLYDLAFAFRGTLATECDRCLADIDLPVSGEQRLLVKLAEEERNEEADVIYIHPEDPFLNVARFIYEFIVLAIPMIKVYDCEDEEPKRCNERMLGYLEAQSEDDKTEESNPLWDELKKLNINQD